MDNSTGKAAPDADLLAKAEGGDAEAQYELASFFEGQDAYDGLAELWYRKAAEQGHTKAQHDLGYFFMGMGGDEENEVESMKWFQRAAEHGDADSQFQMGYAYLNSWGGFEEDAYKAAEWFRKAADKRHPDAMAQLGCLYLDGSGVGAANHHAAYQWLLRATETKGATFEGEPLLDLAWLLSESETFPRDYFEAVYLYRKATDHGFFDAFLKLGWLYLKGLGVTQSASDAYYWFSLGYASVARFKDDPDHDTLKALSGARDQARLQLTATELEQVETLLAVENRKRKFDTPISLGEVGLAPGESW